MEHMAPTKTADPPQAALIPTVDPQVAVTIMIAEAEALRLQGDLAAADGSCAHAAAIHDLSPLGR
jgi:hypothetical protein